MKHAAIVLTDEEAAKLHALGGPSWVRLQLQQAAPPAEGLRSAYCLTASERVQMLAELPVLGRLATAAKYRIKPVAVDNLRRLAAHSPVDSRSERTA